MQQVQASKMTDFTLIDAIFGAFFDAHRDDLRLLLSVKTETFDMRSELEKILRRFMDR